MQKEDKIMFEQYIRTRDTKNQIVKIEFSPSYETGKIKYSDKIRQHRHIEELTDEELVRAYLVVKLVKELRYPIESLEFEKEWEIGRKGKKPWARARADIVVQNQSNNFMLIEVKAPSKYDTDVEEIKTQLFNVASLAKKNLRYLIYYTAEIFAHGIQERLIAIDFKKYRDFDEWEDAGRPNLLGIPKEYGFIRKPIFIKDVNDLNTNIDENGFNRLRKELHNVFWGGGELSDTDIFNNLVKMFLAKIYDEKETPSKKAYQFQVEYKEDKSSGESIQETNDELLERVTKLYKAALKEYLGYSEKEVQNSNIDVSKFSLNKLRYVMETFQSISITKNEHDLLGGFFESIVWSGFKQTKGQYFTPIEIVQFILLTLGIDQICIKVFKDEKRLPYIVDPACGSGTFLIEIMKMITKTITANKGQLVQSARLEGLFNSYFPQHQENYWANKFIYGIEINQDLATSSKVNMVMHGDGSANIICNNALFPFLKYVGKLSETKIIENHPYSKPLNENYDILISNPPFSLDLDKETKKHIEENFEFGETSDSENLFIERWYQLLKPNGVLGVVLPESVFDVSENRTIRLFIYKYFQILAVVSIPTFTFEPYTSTKTSLLFARKRTVEEVKKFQDLWRKSNNKFAILKRKIQHMKKICHDPNLLKHYEKEQGKSVDIIKEYLGSYFDVADYNKDITDILDRYKHEVAEVGKNPDWWIFADVSRNIDYEIPMAYVSEIGYRRLIRSIQQRPNELMQFKEIAGKKQIHIDTNKPKTALDWIRSDRSFINKNWFTINFSDISNHFSLRMNIPYYQFIKFEFDKGIKELPYKTKPLREVLLSIRNGKDVKKEYYSLEETNYIYVLVNNIRKDGFDPNKIVYLQPSKGEELKKYRLTKGDIILNRSIDVGIAYCFDIDDKKIYIPCGFLMIVRLEDGVDPSVVQHFLNTEFLQTYFHRHSTGKIQKSITQPDVKKAPILDIDSSLQEQLSRKLEQERGNIISCKTGIYKSLNNIKDIILLK